MSPPRGAWLASALLVVVLVLVAGRYGFHRDELYFIEGGHHLAWAQPDNPILVPFLAAAWHDLVGGRLWAFRLLPALAAAVTVLVSALMSRALGGSSREQTVTAVVTALTSIVLATGHLFSITTFDVCLTSTTLWLLVRAWQQPERVRRWLLLGMVAGIALEVKVLVAVVLLACLAAMLLVGPRGPLTRPGPWLAAGIAAVLAAPNVIWQARHDWPMLAIAGNIAAGGSVSSASRQAVVYLHLLLVGPVLVPVFVAGLIALVRRPALRPYEWLTIAYAIFLVLVVAGGGKPYYLAGFFPVMLAAGVPPVLRWVDRTRRRQLLAVALLVVGSLPTAFFSLPLAPVGSTVYRVAVAVNPDAGETVGWDGYVATVRSVASALPPEERRASVVLAANYGEAGALSRARRRSAADAALLPPVFSGHNAYADWGPPPTSATTVIVVGRFAPAKLTDWFTRCRQVATLASPPGVDNEEEGAPVRVCHQPRRPWPDLWASIRRLA